MVHRGPTPPRRGLLGGRYELVGCIAVGGSAEVWRVIDTRMGVERAAKILGPGASKEARERLRREARLLAEIGHPNILFPLDMVEEGENLVLVTELCAGSLADQVAQHGPLTPRRAVEVGVSSLAGLAAAHARHVVHRDVKPQNILLTAFGEVRVADFGIASLREEGGSLTLTGVVLGTIPYMAPEQRLPPTPVGPAADQYALAVTLAYCLTGELPGELYASSVQVRLASRLPAPLVAVILRAGADDPSARYANAESMAEALRRVLDELPADDAPSALPVIGTLQPPQRPRPSPVGGYFAACGGCAGSRGVDGPVCRAGF